MVGAFERLLLSGDVDGAVGVERTQVADLDAGPAVYRAKKCGIGAGLRPARGLA